MSATKIGELRRRVVLEEMSRTGDGAGGATQTWTAVATLFASVKSVGGSEGLAFDRMTGRTTHEIIIRYRTDVVPAMRFRLDARIFEIVSALDLDGRRRHLRCLVEERDL